MVDLPLEKNSRTLREARRGQIENLTAIAAVLVSLIAVVANAGVVVQIAGAGMGVAILAVTYPRWGRVRKYRRQDHNSGKNRKDEDV